MRLVTYSASGRESFGVLIGDGIVDGPRLLGDEVTTMRQLLAADLLPRLGDLVANVNTDHALEDVELLPPVPDPDKLLCVGVNYADHRAETRQKDVPEHPTIFSRFRDTQVGHNQPVVHPVNTDQLDYEGEVAIVIGRHVRSVSSDEEAMAAIAGLSCYNDLSVRDWQLHNSQWLPGKNFYGVGSFGPALVTMDEFDDLPSLRLTTRVNGELLQDATLSQLIFDFPAILRYITGFTPLQPGDVIATGTPGGVGLAANPPRFLTLGDVTEIEVTGIGILRNTIVAPQEGE